MAQGNHRGGALAPPTQEEIEVAIDEVVSLLNAYRFDTPKQVRRAQKGRSDRIEVMNAVDLLDTDFEILRARDLAKTPVEVGLKQALHDLGKLLHAYVGDGGMVAVADRICALDGPNESRRMSPINAAWNGIGTWYS